MFSKYLLSAQGFFDFVKEGVIVCDTGCRIAYVNTTAGELLQQDPKSLIGKKLNAVCDDDMVEKLKSRAFLLPKGLVVTFTKKKEPVYKTRVIATPLTDNQNIVGTLLLLRNNNLSFRNSQEQFIERNAALSVIGRIDGQVCVVSDVKAGGHVFVSASVEKLIGWSVSNFLNGGWAFVTTICDPDDLVNVQKQISEQLSRYNDLSYNEPYHMHYRIRHKDGHWIHIEERGCLLERDADGSPRYILAFMQEVNGLMEPVFKRYNLTQRETEVAQSIVEGMSSKKIAEQLGLSVHTVNEVRKNLLRKTTSPNTAALVKSLNGRAR